MKQSLVIGPDSTMGLLAAVLQSWGSSVTRAPDLPVARENLSWLRFDLVAIPGDLEASPSFLDACRAAGAPALLILASDGVPEPEYEPRLVWPKMAPVELLRTPLAALVRATVRESLLDGLSALASAQVDARGAVTWAATHLGPWAALYLANKEGSLSVAATSPDCPQMPDRVSLGDGELGQAASGGGVTRAGSMLVVPLSIEGGTAGVLVVGAQDVTDPGTVRAARVASEVLAARLARHHAAPPGSDAETSKAIAFEKLASLAQLSAGISHEINNPLFVIMGSLDLMAKKVPEETRGMFAQTVKAAERIRKVVADMRRFYMPGQRAGAAPLDLNELVQSATQIVSLHAGFENIQIVHALAEDLPRVDGDDNQLLQVLMNLMTNAGHAMRKGGRIDVRTASLGGGVELTVADQGCGISPENLRRIFDPFYTTKADWTGTGLGLSVTYAILKNHGGSIDVESQVDRGTTVTVRLPAYVPRARLTDAGENR